MTVTTTIRPPLIAIVGPTAVGKTATSLLLAREFPAEIINADSRSFYRGMDIGTAKVTPEERAQAPHHLVDILEPDEPMSLATFQDLAYTTIEAIHARRHLPLLVGGTPQYVNAVVEGWSIPRVAPNDQLRQELEREAERDGVAVLEDRLRAVDPVAAEKNAGNLRRIIRALEVWEATGIPITEQQTKVPPPYDMLELELYAPREFIYDRIDRRVEQQIADGLIDEVRGLLDRGIAPDVSAFGSIGYRQVLPHLDGEASVAEVAERIKLDSHRLVRHQQTWFRKNDRLVRIDVSRPDWEDDIRARVAAIAGPWLRAR